MHHFFADLTASSKGFPILVEFILSHHKIAIDRAGKIKQEWCGRTQPDVAEEWLTDQLKQDRVVLMAARMDNDIKNKIFNDFGLDRREKDIEYIKTANVTAMKYIVTEDIHFYDPKMKKANKATHERMKEGREGRLLRYLEKKLAITVASLRHLKADGKVPADFRVPAYPG
jgi:hypothetical protein